MITVKVTEEEISREALFEMVKNPANGAIATFFGVVRNSNTERRVLAIEYDAFKPLAENVLNTIAGEILKKMGVDIEIVVIHRIGRIMAGEISVACATGSPHREEAFTALRYMIEELKKRVPIWKKETYEDGESWLKGNTLRENDRNSSRGRKIEPHGEKQSPATL